MKCPHCQISIHPDFEKTHITNRSNPSFGIGRIGKNLQWTIEHMVCPACHKAVFLLSGFMANSTVAEFKKIVYPQVGIKAPAPSEVPSDIADDFNDATKVFNESPKASAALSRRCLQSVLGYLGFKNHNLVDAIQDSLDATIFPLSLAENLDSIRVIGNFAAHPIKGTNAAAVASVEPEEAEWNLDVLEELLDFVYVQPAKSRVRRDKLNQKLVAHGKQPIEQAKFSNIHSN